MSNGVNQTNAVKIMPSTIVNLKDSFSNCVDAQGYIIPFYVNYWGFNFTVDNINIRVADGVGYFNGKSYLPESCGKTWIVYNNDRVQTVNVSKIDIFVSSSPRIIFEDPKPIDATYTAYPKYGDNLPKGTSPYSLNILKAGTSFMLFKSSLNDQCIQFLTLSVYLYSRQLAGILDENDCFLFTVKSKLTNLPLFHCKFHKQGFFSAPSTSQIQQFLMRDIFFESSGLIGVLDSFPDIQNSSANIATHLFLAHQITKNERRANKAKLESVAEIE